MAISKEGCPQKAPYVKNTFFILIIINVILLPKTKITGLTKLWYNDFIIVYFFVILTWQLSTGCPNQIYPIFKIPLLPNYKTYRKSEESFGIIGKRATKNTLNMF